MEDLNESSELIIGRGGLYSSFPIPAYRILGIAGEHVANNVLLCLVSHMGKKDKKVFPSILLIAKESGRGKTAVIQGIRTLEEFGFIKKFKYWEPGKRLRSMYYLQESCWNNDRMNREAMAFAPVIGRCGCGAAVKLGEVGTGSIAFHHYGCGDVVSLYSTRKKEVGVQTSVEPAISNCV